MKIDFLNIKNMNKDTENSINMLETYFYEKEVLQRYFSKIFFYFSGAVIPGNMWVLLIKHDVGNSK